MLTINKTTKPNYLPGYRQFHVSKGFVKLMLYLPIVFVAAYTIAWYIPVTHKYALWMAVENHPVEMLTFLFLIAGSLVGLRLAWLYKKRDGDILIPLFLTFFSLGLFFVAMEEIAWGQQFFNFKTPDAVDKINTQHELTLHNIGELQGTSEFFHLFFGFAGIVGAALPLFMFQKIKVPQMLLSWFVTIALVASADLLIDAYSGSKSAQYFMRRLSEVNEMMIGMAGFFYLWLVLRKELGVKSVEVVKKVGAIVTSIPVAKQTFHGS